MPRSLHDVICEFKNAVWVMLRTGILFRFVVGHVAVRILGLSPAAQIAVALLPYYLIAERTVMHNKTRADAWNVAKAFGGPLLQRAGALIRARCVSLLLD